MFVAACLDFAVYTEIVAVNLCVCVRHLKSSEDEHSEYVRIAYVREWIISKTSLDQNHPKNCG